MTLRTVLVLTVALTAVLTLACALSYACSRRYPHVAEAVTDIDATPAEVWSVLAANDRYAEWNPSIVRSEGTLAVGQQVTNTLRWGDGTMTFRPEVLVVQPGRELRWVGRTYLPGVADGEHSFTLEEVRPGVTRLTQREEFTGVIVPFAGGLVRDLPEEFADVNRALAARVASQNARA